MSRSYREPYHGHPEKCKGWKQDWNRMIRRKDEIPNGSYYKKINDRWNSPLENKGCWLGDWREGKMKRK